MEFVALILRSGHIISGTLWLGLGVFTAWILHPFAARIENGDAILQSFYTNSMLPRLMAILAIITTVAGLALYAPIWNSINLTAELGPVGHALLGIGTITGLAAFGHGIGLGRTIDKFANASDDEASELAARVKRSTNVAAILVTVTIVFMSIARYGNIIFS